MADPSFTPGLVKSIPCLDGSHHCRYPDDVYFGETRPTRVWSTDALNASTVPAYFEDYTAKALYVNRDPAPMEVDRALPLPLESPTPFACASTGMRMRTLGLSAAARWRCSAMAIRAARRR